MDNFTKMCSLLKQLQEEWKPEIGDEVLFEECHSIQTIIKIWNPLTKDSDFYYDLSFGNQLKKQDLIFLPDSDWLMEKLEGENIPFEIKSFHLEPSGERGYYATSVCVRFSVPKYKEALLKLVAFELWGLEWKDERWI